MKRVMALMMMASVLVALPAGAALGDDLSPGCAELNNDFWDTTSEGDGIPSWSFVTGETVMVTAMPTDPPGSPTPETIIISIDFAPVKTGTFPGTVTYTFSDEGPFPVNWATDQFGEEVDVVWTVECTAAPIVDTTPPVISLDLTPAGEDDLFEINASCLDDTDGALELDRLTLKVRWHRPVHVTNGQVIEWERGWPPEIEYDDDMLEVEARWVRLRAKCVDAAGNKTFKTKWFRR